MAGFIFNTRKPNRTDKRNDCKAKRSARKGKRSARKAKRSARKAKCKARSEQSACNSEAKSHDSCHDEKDRQATSYSQKVEAGEIAARKGAHYSETSSIDGVHAQNYGNHVQ